MKHKLLSIIPCLLGVSICLADEEVTSANGGDRLKSFYERFEKSDLNGDKILTVDEMHDYLNDKIKDGATSDKAKPPGAKGSFKNLSSRVYLAIFLQESPNTDLNQDGILTKEELLTYVKMQRKVINSKGEKVPAPGNPTVVSAQ
jgi:hypothetical protein